MILAGMPFAYSRDPSLLFQGHEIKHPLNFQSKLCNGIQPVRYIRKILKQDIGDFKTKDETIEVVDIDWIQGKLIAYYNMEEALNGIIALNIENFRIRCPPESSLVYIQETLSLLKRGHSLLHPMCTCKHDLSNQRCKTLGISSMYSDRRQDIPCSLSRRPREFSAAEVSEELGVEDIVLFHVKHQTNANFSLLQLLNQHCNIRIEGLNLHFSHREFILKPIHHKIDLQNLLFKNPLTVALKKDQYHGIWNDLRSLINKGTICCLHEKEDEMLVFHFNPRWDIKAVDHDIRDIWHSINMKDFTKNYNKTDYVKLWTHEVELKRKGCRCDDNNNNNPKKKRKTKLKLLNYSKIKTQ
jgi:hypothetical protein